MFFALNGSARRRGWAAPVGIGGLKPRWALLALQAGGPGISISRTDSAPLHLVAANGGLRERHLTPRLCALCFRASRGAPGTPTHSPAMPPPAKAGRAPSPPDGGWGWAVVFGAFISIGFAYAFPKGLAIFFKEIQDFFGTSYSEIAWVSSIMLATTYGAGE